MNKLCCLILLLLLFSPFKTSAQDTISSKFLIHVGAEIIPGLTLGWESKDYKIFPHYYDGENGSSIYHYFIAYGVHSDFYFNRLIVSAGALSLFESFFAYVDPFYQGYFNVHAPHYDLYYNARYLDFPFSVGWAFNKNAENKKTFIKAGATISFIFYERNKIYNSSIFYMGSGPLLADYTKYTYNKEVITKKVKYNRTCILFTLGRETPFIKNTPIYFKRALTFITAPFNIKRYTTEIFTSSRLGLEFGFSYRFK